MPARVGVSVIVARGQASESDHVATKSHKKCCNPYSNPEVLNVKYMREISRLIDKYRM